MRQPITIDRPQITARPATPQRRNPIAVRPPSISAIPIVAPAPAPAPEETTPSMDGPYLDYSRWLTVEGGILLVYKDLDERLRHTLWRLFAWSLSTGWECWYVLHHSPVQALWINIACLIAVGIVNLLIVARPVELYRHLEIRPDCMIIDGADLFWTRYMECGWPQFQAGENGFQTLAGIYGTRWVHYLTVRRFDENDRMAEVLASHFQDAVRQLWTGQH